MKIMLKYPLYFRRYGLRLPAQLMTPRVFPLTTLGLSRECVLHYLPESETEVGPSSDHPLLASATRLIYISHVTELTSRVGNPRKSFVQPGPMIEGYRRKYRKIRPMLKLEMVTRDDQNVLVVNYGLLPKLNRYIRSAFTGYYSWLNMRVTVVDKMIEMIANTKRNQYLSMVLPDRMPSLQQLRKAEVNRTRETLKPFATREALDFLDLWTWLGKHRASSSQLGKLSKEDLQHVNLLVRLKGKWMLINLGVLDSWRADPTDKKSKGMEPASFQLRFLKMMAVVYDAANLGEEKAPVEAAGDNMETPVVDEVEASKQEEQDDDNSDEDIRKQLDELDDKGEVQEIEDELAELDTVEKEESLSEDMFDEDGNYIGTQVIEPMPQAVGSIGIRDRRPEAAIMQKADELLDRGLVSAAEYKRMEKLSRAYRDIPNPYGQDGFLVDATVITEDEIKIEKRARIPDQPQVLDKSMLESTVEDLDRKYIETTLPKDIVASVLMVQQAGIAVTGYDVERVKDAVSDYEVHRVQLTPAVGKQSTLTFRVPKLRPNGTYMSNGVTYRARKQRADLPIRKVSPDRVALTSYYSKVFVDRSERSVFNYARWLGNAVVAKGLDPEDTVITDLRVSNVADERVKVPPVYAILSARCKSLVCEGFQYWFDYKHRFEHGPFTEGDRALENRGMVLVAKRGEEVLLMDQTDTLYLSTGKGDLSVHGRVEDVFALDAGKAPIEMAEVKVFSKVIPAGVVLAYLVGFDNLLKLLAVTPRRVVNGERMNLASFEFALRFSDESLIFNREDPAVNLILAGFNLYRNVLRNYSVYTFDKKDVYLNLMEQNGITVRYLRELDLMDAMFVDPVTKGILEWMKEPTEFTRLILRAVAMLCDRHVPQHIKHPDGAKYSLERAKGYERFAGAVYSELVKAIRLYNARTVTAKATVSMNPHAVWTTIVQDSSASPIEEANPIHNLKEKEVITFGGTGGRSRRSMVADTRLFKEEDMGFISEATVDSGDVAIITYMSPNANLVNTRGVVRMYDKEQDGTSSLLSTAALLAPGADRDDPKRVNISSLAS